MGTSGPEESFEELFAHEEWVRRLALRLCSSNADDVAQETWIEALRRPGDARSPRAWLGGIVRHLARSTRRDERARAEHELDGARETKIPSPDELLARAELQRRVLAAVAELDEPYRVIVLMRYYQGLDSNDIAERLAMSGSTVRNRLARAHERLRAKLDKDYGGDHSAWAMLFVPGMTSMAPHHVATGVGITIKIVTVSVVAAAVLGVTLLWRSADLAGPQMRTTHMLLETEKSHRAPESSVAPEMTIAEPTPVRTRDVVLPASIMDPAALHANRAPSNHSKDEAAATAPTNKLASYTLYGFLRPAAGQLIPTDADVSLSDHLGERQSARCGSDGAYSFSGLDAGRYWIGAWSSRYGSAHAELDLEDEALDKRLDLQLVLPTDVLVKATDRDGKPIEMTNRMSAIATDEPPAEWVYDISENPTEHYGSGIFRWERGLGAGETDVVIGTLTLDRADPVYVSLVTYQHVVATQRAEPGQAEVVFVLDRNASALQPGRLRVRFIDAETRAPVDAKSVMLDGYGQQFVQRDGDSFRAPTLQPGWWRIQVVSKGYERLRRRVLISPGVETDLGDVELQHEQWISGTVIDGNGRGCVMNISWNEYDREKGAAPNMGVVYAQPSQSDGSFRVGGLSRGLYLLSTSSREKTPWAVWCRLIDTNAGPVENVSIELARGVNLVLRASDPENWELVRFKILDDAGTIVRRSRLASDKPLPILLAPGRYTVEARIDETSESKRIPITIVSQSVELAIP